MAKSLDASLRQPIHELVAAVQSGTITARSLVQAALDRVAETESYHTVLELNPEALNEADAVDRRVAAGEKVGLLAGIPFLAKDNFLTVGTHTTAASHILEPFQAPYEAESVQRVRAAGAILVGKANLDAFGHGSSTENSDYGPTLNPVDSAYVPGGSSGGSAAALALGQVCFALATDTGGSIRQPAAFSGVVGLKPTYGLVPRTGVIAMASSTDVVGPLANRVVDAAVVLEVLAGKAASDGTSIERDTHSYIPTGAAAFKGLRVGVIQEYLGAGINGEVKAGIESTMTALAEQGAVVENVSVPATQLALAAYYVLVPAEISSNLARYDGIKFGYSSPDAKNLEETYRQSREQGFGAEAKRRIMIGTYVLSSGYYDAYYKRAQKVRTKLIAEFAEAFAQYDVLLGPTAPTPAFKLGQNDQDPLAMYLNDVCTVAVNLVGCAAISLPNGLTTAGLPYGVQLLAPQHGEKALLERALALEELLAHNKVTT